jgi:nucleotide-binding universal stress UspA family protein
VEVLDQDPVSAILEAAGAHAADAIVIGSEHRSRLQAAIGTVTEELLKAAAVPVIAVP